MSTLIGPKNVSFVGGTYQYDVVFNYNDFSVATGFAQLQGPLSLSIDIRNNAQSVWYIGVIIERDIGTITIADRTHIAGIDVLSTATISSASIPQLARIDGIITKITIRISVFDSVFYTPAGISTIALRIDPPSPVISPPLYLGKDIKIQEPSYHQSFYLSGQAVPAGSAVYTIVDTGAMTSPFRFKVKAVQGYLFPTPSFPGDTHLTARITRFDGVITELFEIYSDCDRYMREFYVDEFVLNIGERLQILCDNFNSSKAYNASGHIFGEYIY